MPPWIKANTTRLELVGLLTLLGVLWTVLSSMGYTGPGAHAEVQALTRKQDSVNRAQDDRLSLIGSQVDATYRLLCVQSDSMYRRAAGVKCPP